MSSNRTSEFARFAAVAVAGLIVDIGVAWLCWTLFGVGLTVSAAIGFIAGALVNYLLHEFWTFKRAESRVSVSRIARYGVALAATLAVRLAAVSSLSVMLDAERYALSILILATGASFIVNYVMSKFIVFNAKEGRTP